MDQDMEVDITNTQSRDLINTFSLSEVLPITLNCRSIEWGSGITTFGQELDVEVSYCQKAVKVIYQNLLEEKNKAVILIEGLRTVLMQYEGLDKNTIFNIRDEINQKFLCTLRYCQEYIRTMQNYLLCYQRSQQLREIGVELHPAVVDIQEIHGLCDKLLKFILEMSSIIQGVIINLHGQNTCWDIITNVSYYEIEFNKLERSIYEKFSLIVIQQPEQILQTKRERPVQLRFFSFNDSLLDRINLQIYLISETSVKSVQEVLPTEVDTAGTLIMAGRTRFFETLGICGRRKRKYSSDNNRCSKITPVGVEVKSNNVNTNPNHPYLTMQLPLKIMEVVRKHNGSENIASEKYSFLFVAEVAIRGQIIKVWNTTLPVIVTTHISHSERAWATIAWDNAFPAPGRKGFEVQATASWSQFSEMLQGLFKKWVGVGRTLKPDHLGWMKSKLKLGNFPTFSKISWSEIMREDGGPSFWCWFYKSSLIAQGHLKEAWNNGHIEGFIGAEEACALLLNGNVQPGTFIVRFSDSVPGSISLVVLVINGKDVTACRVTPLEFYKNRAFSECKASLLTQLNSQHSVSHAKIFHWVYPNVEKEVAFAKFYEDAAPRKLNKKPYAGMCTILDSNVSDGKSEQENGFDTPSMHSKDTSMDATDVVITQERIPNQENVWQNVCTSELEEWVFQYLTDYDFGS